MPPSGYNRNQAELICDFLRSCVNSLVQENIGLRDSKTALRREIESITRDLEQGKRQGFERDLLGLTQAFYEDVLKDCPQHLERLAEYSETRLATLCSRILAIHVAV